MAELGSTSDPKALIPGDPDAIDKNVTAIGGRGNSMALAGQSLQAINTGDTWTGDGADAFRTVFQTQPVKWLSAADAFINTSTTLSQYAGVLRWAQGQAKEAIRKYDEAQAATRKAINEHNAAVTRANATNAANAAAGSPIRETVPPFVDPGVEGRAAAHGTLNRARTQLHDAGETAAKNIQTQQAHAPAAPHHRSGIWDYVKEVGGGLGDSLTGTWDTLKYLMTTNPAVIATDMTFSILSDPKQFGKDLLNWDEWANNPARAVGSLIPDAVTTVASGGVGGVAKKAAEETIEAGAEKGAAKAAGEAAGESRTRLHMAYKDGLTEAQAKAWDEKVKAFNDGVREKGFQQETGPFTRDPKVRKEFLESMGLERVPTGQHVDHVVDLQAGGIDHMSNMQLLDSTVNTSFGSRLSKLMGEHPPGTVFGAVEMIRE